MPKAPPNVTDLLIAWSGGNKEALDELIPLVYDELRRQAARYLRRENEDGRWRCGSERAAIIAAMSSSSDGR